MVEGGGCIYIIRETESNNRTADHGSPPEGPHIREDFKNKGETTVGYIYASEGPCSYVVGTRQHWTMTGEEWVTPPPHLGEVRILTEQIPVSRT